jgi:hypothetical protein
MALCSSQVLWKVPVVGAAVVCFFSVSVGRSPAQPIVTNSGTLTCTVADVANKANSIIDLSCNFKSQTGATSDYVGSAGTKTGGFPPAKFVFVWTVVAIEAGKGPLLEGTFTAQTGREGPPVLIDGRDGTTRLEPAADKDQVPGPGEITILTLELVATKT